MYSKKKRQVNEENDPDTLQMNDELNEAWINSWKKTLDSANSPGVSLIINSEKNVQNVRTKK